VSLCYDFEAQKWVDGIDGTKMRLAQLRASLPMLKDGHQLFCVDLRKKIADGQVKMGPGSPQSPFSDALYAHEKMIREYEAVLTAEEDAHPKRPTVPPKVPNFRVRSTSMPHLDMILVETIDNDTGAITERGRFQGSNADKDAGALIRHLTYIPSDFSS
jgi:hypothetical protein